MTWLALLNYLVQFLFIRVFKSEDIDGSYPRRGYDVYRVSYGVMFFILPFSGWWSSFISIGRLRMKVLTGVHYKVRKHE